MNGKLCKDGRDIYFSEIDPLRERSGLRTGASPLFIISTPLDSTGASSSSSPPARPLGIHSSCPSPSDRLGLSGSLVTPVEAKVSQESFNY